MNPINFQKKRGRKKKVKKLILPFIIIAVLIGVVFLIKSLSGSSSVVSQIFSGNNLKSNNDRVNVLLLGIAGGTHDGASLTDTIMVVSYNLKTNQVFLISLPRDLWLPELRSKANAVYEIGLSSKNGLGLAKTVMGNVLGIPIQYAMRVDFRGFEQVVDAIGGIDVDVANSFDDYLYPIQGKEDDSCDYTEKEIDVTAEQAKQLNIDQGKMKVFIAPDGKIATDAAQEDKGIKYFSCRYEHISFQKGVTHMDGTMALKYARSRHGTGSEGSDFARSARQEKAIQAIRKKILSPQTLFNPGKISDLLKALGQSIDTDISPKEAIEFYNLSKKMDQSVSLTIDDSPKNNLPNNRTSLLIHPLAQDYGGAYVLISGDDDFSIVQGYVKKVLTGEISPYEATAAARIR